MFVSANYKFPVVVNGFLVFYLRGGASSVACSDQGILAVISSERAL